MLTLPATASSLMLSPPRRVRKLLLVALPRASAPLIRMARPAPTSKLPNVPIWPSCGAPVPLAARTFEVLDDHIIAGAGIGIEQVQIPAGEDTGKFIGIEVETGQISNAAQGHHTGAIAIDRDECGLVRAAPAVRCCRYSYWQRWC